jgi:hypothetical protein
MICESDRFLRFAFTGEREVALRKEIYKSLHANRHTEDPNKMLHRLDSKTVVMVSRLNSRFSTDDKIRDYEAWLDWQRKHPRGPGFLDYEWYYSDDE